MSADFLLESIRLEAASDNAEQTELRLRAQCAEQAETFPIPAVMAATPSPESSL